MRKNCFFMNEITFAEYQSIIFLEYFSNRSKWLWTGGLYLSTFTRQTKWQFSLLISNRRFSSKSWMKTKSDRRWNSYIWRWSGTLVFFDLNAVGTMMTSLFTITTKMRCFLAIGLFLGIVRSCRYSISFLLNSNFFHLNNNFLITFCS